MNDRKKPERKPAVPECELTSDDLAHVAGGTKAKASAFFLVFTFKLVAVKTVS